MFIANAPTPGSSAPEERNVYGFPRMKPNQLNRKGREEFRKAGAKSQPRMILRDSLRNPWHTLRFKS